MTRDEVISMAREAAFHTLVQEDELMRFAALVAAHEREECAKIVDDWYNSLASEPEMAYIAAEIRSRT